MALNKLIRKRYIPMETLILDKDTILYDSPELVITSWQTIRPRNDIASGVSGYFIKEGIKVTRMMNSDGDPVHWYCDIVHITCENDTLTCEDLLFDVIIDNDGSVRVVDADEAAQALEQKLISQDMLCGALRSLNLLLTDIYTGQFSKYSDRILPYCKKNKPM